TQGNVEERKDLQACHQSSPHAKCRFCINTAGMHPRLDHDGSMWRKIVASMASKSPQRKTIFIRKQTQKSPARGRASQALCGCTNHVAKATSRTARSAQMRMGIRM
ncbi:MAG TPA: hypothetical protein VIM67_13105, partial [Terriglobus sp.]